MGHDNGLAGRDRVESNCAGLAPSLAFGLGTPTRGYRDFLPVKQDNIPEGGVVTLGLPGYTSPDPTRPCITDATRVDPENFYGIRQDHDRVRSDHHPARLFRESGDA